ncbi:hypothetical protein [Bradyrhizobium sp. STM 3561]|uniref:hypothetical protein n=1 Tax=Bradyrhizobium sp. STM 3561 TaxID=578923 RepID=UPI00388F5E4A
MTLYASEAILTAAIIGLMPLIGNHEPACEGTNFERTQLSCHQRWSIIAMRIEYLSAIVIAVLAVNSLGSLPTELQSTPVAPQVADRLALSMDPFLMRSGG